MRILLADDHNLVREGLKPFLMELDESAEIVEACDFTEAFAIADAPGELTLIVLDLKMPGMNGVTGIETIKARRPEVPVVIISGYVSREDVMNATRVGASGYIPKTITGAAMINALRLVLSGETYLPSQVFTDGEAAKATEPQPLNSLSARERQILGLLIDGHTNKEIARQLDLQEITIKIHLRNVYRKIGAANRAQAVRIALMAGWAPMPATA